MEGIVAGGVDYQDHDRIVRLLTPDRGRTAVLARGVRGGKRRRLAAAMSPGTRVDLELRRGRGPLGIVNDAAVLAEPGRSRADLVRLAQLTYGVELCHDLAPEHHEAHKLYGLLLSWLGRLEGDEPPGIASRQALEAKALTFAGLTPSLVGCAVCGERLDAPAVFSNEAGGGAHGRCARGVGVEPEQLVRLEALRRTPLAETAGVAPSRPHWLLADFVAWSLGHGLNSRSLLEEVESD